MHIALAGPIAGDDIRTYLHDSSGSVPAGFSGAPLTGILIGELLRMGHRVTGITSDPTLRLKSGSVQLEGPGFTFVACPWRPHAWRLNGLRLGRAIDFFAIERRLLTEAMVRAAPDIVHAHWSYEYALAALDQPAPNLITCHDSPAVVLRFNRSFYRGIRYLMACNVFRRGHEFTTVSDYMARELSRLLGHVPQVVPNPVDSQILTFGKSRTASRSRHLAMVCNGWDRRKNPEPALRAFALWRAIEPSAELHLFGSGFGAGEAAQRWADAKGLSAGMHFRGRLPHRSLVAALVEMDALLHPALEESFGVVLAEAMALGLPVVAGRYSGAVPWVLGADSSGGTNAGVLTDVSSPSALVRALQLLFDSDYGERSSNGLARARELFSPSGVAAEYVSRYERVLTASR